MKNKERIVLVRHGFCWINKETGEVFAWSQESEDETGCFVDCGNMKKYAFLHYIGSEDYALVEEI